MTMNLARILQWTGKQEFGYGVNFVLGIIRLPKDTKIIFLEPGESSRVFVSSV